ncbi:MAG: hypothetical protein RSB08_00060, partial [Clostridia bacterium]
MLTYKEKLQYIDRLLPDENVKSIIFNYANKYENFFSDEKVCLQYFSNILTFSYFTIYSKFLTWIKKFNEKKQNEREVDQFSNSMIRIYNLLNSTYNPMKVNSDFIENLIINLQIDFMLKNNVSNSFLTTLGLQEFFNFNNNKLTTYIHALKQSRLSTRFSANFGFQELCECIKMFPFLSECKVEIIDNKKCNDLQNIVLAFNSDSMEIKYNELMLVKNEMVFYLEDFNFIDPKVFDENNEKNQKIILNYIATEQKLQFDVSLSDCNLIDFNNYLIVEDDIIENFLIDYDIINLSNIHSGSFFFKGCIAVNNNYLKYLALTISDMISSATKDKIIAKYYNKYKNIFKTFYVKSLYKNNNITSYSWDEIIIFLLLEEGVFDFIKYLLSCEKYDAFLSAFKLRFGVVVNDLMNDEKSINDPTANLLYTSEDKRTTCQAKAIIYLATKLLYFSETRMTKNFYPASISDYIVEMHAIIVSNKTIIDKLFSLLSKLFKINNFLYIFYSSVFDYIQEKKCSELSDFENLTLENQKKENAKYLAKLRRNVIKIKQNKINYIDLLKIDVNNVNNIEQLVRFINNSFEKILELNCNYSQRNTLKNEILFEVFGVRTMFDNESIVAFMEKIVNLIKTFNCDLKTNDCEQLKKLYEFLVEYFLFLQGTGINDSLTNNIYPLVANYASGVNSVDGYTFAYFNVENTQSKTFNKIKVITGDEYSFDETYYCVPNINRIAKIEDENDVYKEIWISPIIIPCSIFYSNFVANITRLDNVSDYAATAALIYETDEQIYSSLFGSKENALKILPLLFENNFSNFYKDNIFICKKDQQV